MVDAPVDEVTAQLREATDHDPDTTFADLALADARARVEDAIDVGAVTYPPLESETWPVCRPLVEWVLRAMPEGGTGFARPEWDEQSRAALADRFLASPWAGDLDGDDVALLDSLLWFACDYGPADPRRWSTTRVEMLLADWLPRKVIADADFLARGRSTPTSPTTSRRSASRVADVVALTDAACDALLDAECRTATPLTDWFGVSGSVTQRATTLLKAVGVRRDPTTSDLALGTPRYLTGDRRQTMIERRSGSGLTCPPASGSR